MMKRIKNLLGLSLIVCCSIICIACQPEVVDPPPPEVLPFDCEDFHSQLDFSAYCGLDAEVHFSIVAGLEGHCLIHQIDPTPDWEYSDLIYINISESDPELTPTLFYAEYGEPDDDLTEVEGIGDYCLVEEDLSSDEVVALYFYFYKGPFLCYIEISGMDCLNEEDAYELVQQISDLL